MKTPFRATLGPISMLFILIFVGISNAVSRDNPKVLREVKLTARNSIVEPNAITTRKGEPVMLVVTSADADHRVSVQDFGVSLQVKKGATETLEFVPERDGKFPVSCFLSDRGSHTVRGEPISTGGASQPSALTMKISFDPDTPGVVYVESNGERVRIDTNNKDYARVTEMEKDRPEPGSQDSSPTKSGENVSRATEPYDYQIVNVPTPKRIAKGSFNVHFSHRFSSTISGQGQDFEDVASELFGLDSASVSSLGFTYGFTSRLYGKILRSPVCDSSALCKTIEMGVGLHLMDEGGNSPVALSVYGSIEGNNNFTENFSYNLQTMLARSITDRLTLFFSPAIHLKTNGYGRFNPRPGRFFNDAQIAEDFRLGEHTASFGFGANARVTDRTSLLFEYVPRTGFELGRIEPIFDENFTFIGYNNRSFPAIGFGIEKRLGRHAFSLTFSNTQTTTTSRYNSSNINLPRDRFVIGFNLFRRLL